MSRRPIASRSWSIILAGGEGERIQPFIRRWLGHVRPKQYCTFVGTRSLLQHTVDRADVLTPPSRRILVAAPHHDRYLEEQMGRRDRGRILLQPNNRGTAAGIFLPLTHVLARDPDAVVTVFPSDHFVYPEAAFTDAVGRARAVSVELGGRPVVLGVPADERDGDYGWIQRGKAITCAGGEPAWEVERFLEKPGRGAQETVRDAFWNTFVITGSARLLWELGWRYVPEVITPFAEFLDSIDTAREASALARIYDGMPQRDFSAHVLEPGAAHLALMSLERVYWSDWGREERVADSLERFGIAMPHAVGGLRGVREPKTAVPRMVLDSGSTNG